MTPEDIREENLREERAAYLSYLEGLEAQRRESERDEMRRYVARGVSVLDADGPEDWRDRIDLERLDMASTFQCVLGQVYREDFDACSYGRSETPTPFDFGVLALLTDSDGVAYGNSEQHGFSTAYGYDALAELWREALEVRA